MLWFPVISRPCRQLLSVHHELVWLIKCGCILIMICYDLKLFGQCIFHYKASYKVTVYHKMLIKLARIILCWNWHVPIFEIVIPFLKFSHKFCQTWLLLWKFIYGSFCVVRLRSIISVWRYPRFHIFECCMDINNIPY